MVRSASVTKKITQLGYEPLDNQAIIVKYGTENLSNRVADFFNGKFYVLQVCRNEIILVPFSEYTGMLKKEVVLELPLSSIHDIAIHSNGLNYDLLFDTAEGLFHLTVQQKELSEFRSSGSYGNDTLLGLGSKNWHKENLGYTLDALASIWN